MLQLAEAQEMHISVEHVDMGTSDALVDIWVKFESNRDIGLTNLPTPGKMFNQDFVNFFSESW